MLDLVFRNTTGGRAFGRKYFEEALRAAIKAARLPYRTIEVSVSLVGPAKMRALNKKYRHKDAPTDVLSFPLGERYGKGYTIFTAGDLFLCLSYAKTKAADQGIPFKEYVAWMTVHGFLHLIGYDHERSKKAEQKMSAMETKILKKLATKS